MLKMIIIIERNLSSKKNLGENDRKFHLFRLLFLFPLFYNTFCLEIRFFFVLYETEMNENLTDFIPILLSSEAFLIFLGFFIFGTKNIFNLSAKRFFSICFEQNFPRIYVCCCCRSNNNCALHCHVRLRTNLFD